MPILSGFHLPTGSMFLMLETAFVDCFDGNEAKARWVFNGPLRRALEGSMIESSVVAHHILRGKMQDTHDLANCQIQRFVACGTRRQPDHSSHMSVSWQRTGIAQRETRRRRIVYSDRDAATWRVPLCEVSPRWGGRVLGAQSAARSCRQRVGTTVRPVAATRSK